MDWERGKKESVKEKRGELMKGCLDGVKIKWWGKEIGLLWRKEWKSTNKLLFLKKVEKLNVKERKEGEWKSGLLPEVKLAHQQERTCCQGDKRQRWPRPPLPCFTRWCHHLLPGLDRPLANGTKAPEGAACPLAPPPSLCSLFHQVLARARLLVCCPLSFPRPSFSSASGQLQEPPLAGFPVRNEAD